MIIAAAVEAVGLARFDLQTGSAFDLQLISIHDSATPTIEHDKNLVHIRVQMRFNACAWWNARLGQLGQMG